MSLSEEKNLGRRNEFFRKLEDLMGEFPELTQPTEEVMEHLEEMHSEYDIEAPMLITGITLVFTCRNAYDWENVFYVTPYGQSHFHTLGMLINVADLAK
jgi:hypothetical protein